MRALPAITGRTARLLLAVIGTVAMAAPPAIAGAGQAHDNGGAALGPSRAGLHYGVGEITVTYTDFSRRVWIPGRGPEPRQLETIIRYPTPIASQTDAVNASPARAAGPFPLVVFAEGFDITPTPYAALLRAWVRAGYVVAAPIFPLTNPSAPGGPNESDLVNQPTDMSFVITRLLAAAAAPRGVLAGLLAPRQIAVAGQSDGGSTVLAAAYNSHYFDHRIRAAMILSGAMIPGVGGYDFPASSPPMLATQGTGDTVNAPASTYHFFGLARRPKFLLSLLGAPHLGPYTNEQPQLGVVERVTVAFLDHFVKRLPGAGWRLWSTGNVPGVATLHN